MYVCVYVYTYAVCYNRPRFPGYMLNLMYVCIHVSFIVLYFHLLILPLELIGTFVF